MRSKWKIWLKRVLALAVALLVLNAYCYWYYNPTAYLQDESRATDVIREPGAFTSRMKEGFAWSTMDANGYNNAAVPGEAGVYALMMGASHTEGMNIMQHETTSAQLTDLLAEKGIEGCAYNIGISSHMLPQNFANLDRALKRFQPQKYVVIETPDIIIRSYTALQSAMVDDLERISDTSLPVPKWISDQPLLKTLYRQWMSMREEPSGKSDPELGENVQEIMDFYGGDLEKMFSQMRETAAKYGVEVIIYYHPQLFLQPDGSAQAMTGQIFLDVFAQACETAGVHFLDMTDIFLEAYAREHILPHGFSNTAPGAGHLNRNGCAMIAKALCDYMTGEEAAA